MANTIININEAASIVCKGMAQELVDNLKFVKSIDKVDESDFKGKNDFYAGNKLTVALPARYIPENDFDITSSSMESTEEQKSMTLDIIKTVPMQFSSLELATEVGIKSTLNRFALPAARSIAQYFEQECLKRATQATYNLSGAAGSNSFTVADVLAGGTNLDEMLCPMDERFFLTDSASGALAVDARKGLFQSSTNIAEQYKKGYMGEADGFEWMKNQLIYTHTNGADVTGVTVNATATEAASTVSLTGLTISTTGIIKKGTVFTISGVNKVHPVTKTNTGKLQQFVVTADANSDGSGVATVSISPALYTATSTTLQNITALPQSAANVVFSGAANTSYAQSLQYHPSAFRVATVPLEMPTAVEFAAQETVEGITVSLIRAFDVLQRRWITRVDLLGGFLPVRAEWCNRVTA